jgi:integration host factor subunit alpha
MNWWSASVFANLAPKSAVPAPRRDFHLGQGVMIRQVLHRLLPSGLQLWDGPYIPCPIKKSEKSGGVTNMTLPTVTRSELSEAINRTVGLSRAESGRMVETILEAITDALVRGNEVKLTGFGTFTLRDKRQRIGRNPKTGVEVPILPRRVLGFRASQSIRDRIADAQ